jgi:hypothetical protein
MQTPKKPEHQEPTHGVPKVDQGKADPPAAAEHAARVNPAGHKVDHGMTREGRPIETADHDEGLADHAVAKDHGSVMAAEHHARQEHQAKSDDSHHLRHAPRPHSNMPAHEKKEHANRMMDLRNRLAALGPHPVPGSYAIELIDLITGHKEEHHDGK